MSQALIRIRKARQNNLAGVDVDLPAQRLVAITGVSGSGKSSLAFDTLFREGQRRFLATLSAYARQFLGRMEKPDVESIEGLSPAVAVDQKSVARGARSTVGTLTEIVDHLRVLYARAGRPHCPACGRPVEGKSPEEIAQAVLGAWAGAKVLVLAPLVRGRKGHHKALLEELQKKGFVRVRVDGRVQRLEEVGELARYKVHTIEAVVDRLEPDPEKPSRLREALEQALALGEGEVVIAPAEPEAGREESAYSTSRSCRGCGGEIPPLEPRLFSFNSPVGACPECEGLGLAHEPSEEAVVADGSLSIRAGALAVTRKGGGALLYPHVDFAFLEQVAKAHGFDLDTPWDELPEKARRVLLHGAGDERYEAEASWEGKRWQGNVRWRKRFGGVLPALQRATGSAAGRRRVERFLRVRACSACEGSRLNAAARAVRLGDATLDELGRLPIERLGARVDGLALTARERTIGRDLLIEVRRRIEFLLEVGLGYLTLDRAADTLSGGEAQRIRLAAQLGAGLSGVMYVLDEPSIGLHWRDHARLIGALRRLRDLGNSVIVVEHDEGTLRAADWLVDVGPGAGRHGGRIAAAGTPDQVARADTPTGALLRGEIELAAPAARRPGNGEALVVEGARAFNLKDVSVRFPLGTLTAVTGVSGSGKSTLVQRVLERAVLRKLGREAPEPLAHRRIRGLEHVDDLVAIDAAPIGRTPRSNPATYTGVFTPIRDLFSALPEARMRGYTRSRFSFNVAGGRCEACGGAGAQYVELQFLAPVTVPCEECGGQRFQAETLDVRYQGRSIADVLSLTVEDAAALFADHPKIARPLALMQEIGLGYLTLGQPSTTLSGGEAQRIKLVTHLQKRAAGHVLYVLDEPTTGLHQQDVARLVAALQRLVEMGHSVLVIEHNLDLVRAADHVIDLGPEGGEAGGELVAVGTPEELEREARSHTGQALAELARSRARGLLRDPGARAEALVPLEAPREIRVQGARTHNLAAVDVAIPRESLCVLTGPSGSGKSSLALDTIHAEGRRRFVESLSTYARQFLGARDRPPVDRVEGLGPSVAVEARGAGSHPRSTVATTTEIHDHLRVLWARAGTRRCPAHGHALEKADASVLARRVLAKLAGEKGWIVAPLWPRHASGAPPPAASVDGPQARSSETVEEPSEEPWSERLATLRAAGFVRALVDGRELRLDEELPAIGPATRFELVVDRVAFGASARARLAEAIEQAEAASGGRVAFVTKGGARLELSTRGACPECGFRIEGELEPRHFSFNTHVGACPECDGLGESVSCDEALLVTHPEKPLLAGAVHGRLSRWLVKGKGYYEHLVRQVAAEHRIDLRKPWSALTDAQRALLAHGTGAKARYDVTIERETRNAEIEERFRADWPGLCGHVDAWYRRTEDAEWAGILEGVMSKRVCPLCEGERLAPASRAVTLGKKRLPELLRASVREAAEWTRAQRAAAERGGASAAARELERVRPVLDELHGRLELLERVGLGYLTLDRQTASLSGGEQRRVRLSASLGSRLVGVTYVLDEPTVGLHPRDVDRLVDSLAELRDLGNTVLVVEHDPAVMRRADWLLELGPGAGRRGGRVVAAGPPRALERDEGSTTGAILRGSLALARPAEEEAAASPRADAERRVTLRGARLHNLAGVDLELRFGEITGVCGPSGSGKSTLVLEALVPALRGERPEGRWRTLAGLPGGGARVVVVDSAPIGRTPSSCPATYAGVLEPLRELFARTPDARQRGFSASRFSFNSTQGRCPTCEGKGAVKVEMQFLADLWLTCEDCGGKRYQPEVLEVRWRGRSIADVLELEVGEALALFDALPEVVERLRTLEAVGLGYLQLGQSATTLSGGEAQRLKLAGELVRARAGVASVLVLDEPSTGLAVSDLVPLVAVLHRLARGGDAVILVEHHTGLLALCDRLVELGPGGGSEGGRVIARGTPAELARDRASVTGPFLAGELGGAGARQDRGRRGRGREREVAG